ncbi:MAG: hypothetical protein HC767_01050 [Akkermansiaceae bacterium]|nr:hypothetical protein [Akkermansiaceae bacterium]
MEWSPDGSTLATSSDIMDNSVKLWNTETGALRQSLKGHSEMVSAAAWSPDGTMLATASHDGTTRLWSNRTGAIIHVLEGHTHHVVSVAWTPRGDEVLTASEDGTVRIYRVAKRNRSTALSIR